MDPVLEEALPGFLAKDLNAYFEMFHNFYRQWLFLVSCRLIGNPDDAEDLTQETFMLVWEILKRKQAEEIVKIKFRPYLRRTATNCFINTRRKGCLSTVSLDAPESQERLEVLDDVFFEQPESALERKESDQRVYDLLRSIPQEYRIVVVLRWIEGLNLTEIGRVLGVSRFIANKRLKKGMQLLKMATSEPGYQHSSCI